MTSSTVLKSLQDTYSEVSGVVSKANRTLLECEVFISEAEHQMGKNIEVENIDDYFSGLVSKERDEKDSND
jgi:hypothetical protein